MGIIKRDSRLVSSSRQWQITQKEANYEHVTT